MLPCSTTEAVRAPVKRKDERSNRSGADVRSDVVWQTASLPARQCGFESRRSHG
jgi:hypothetical protein